jgi:hypothetical protein
MVIIYCTQRPNNILSFLAYALLVVAETYTRSVTYSTFSRLFPCGVTGAPRRYRLSLSE